MNKRKRFEKLFRKYASLTDAQRLAPENAALLQEMYLLAPPEVKRRIDAAGERLRAEIGLKPSRVGADGRAYFSVDDVAKAFGMPVEEVEAEAARLQARHGDACGIHSVDPDSLCRVH